MKRWVIVLGLAGLAGALALVLASNAGEILTLIASMQWGVGAIVLFHLFPVALSAAAWRVVGAGTAPVSGPVFAWARILREGVNDLLPAAQIGGVAASVRALILAGWRGRGPFSSTFVDVTLESASQVVFVLLGVVFLWIDGRAPHAALWALVGAGLLAAGLAGFVFLQHAGIIRSSERWIRRAISGFAGADASEDIQSGVVALYRRADLIIAGFALHLVCWVVGVGEVWLVLNLIGASCTWRDAFILESLGTAIRSAAFMIPAGLGVQEGGYLLLGTALGYSAPVSLALSLTKRVREILIGAPALIAWQIIEGRRLARAHTSVK